MQTFYKDILQIKDIVINQIANCIDDSIVRGDKDKKY